ncbi:mitochondrial integral membrane protein (IMP) complex Imp1 (core peptidase) [Andalucia godoyi]|uniref:Mitochondrial integral membrane protein (IMP) complex Imp1 (Core peptidase) n=1 Tax=Andalucia godoyi TaxID=505711 RepID=A0A8K0AG73_ANDGO|nr:mitochondrial integral membrane protein (IMP) complex Imp1 (core peptidase) [Andalucia godoyi]|eukprot:ANDGO_08086.mRNA.1 mitochondrial integral membrane protein (IMP) complex Imp1 (core peptidase)
MQRLVRTVFTSCKYALVTISAVEVFQSNVGTLAVSTGPSMWPTLTDGVNVSVISKVSSSDRGDVVVFRSPEDRSKSIVKRLVAMEGDRVLVRGRWVEIPRNCAWIEGDNKTQSRDSRHFGPVSLSLYEGKVVCNVWPVHSAGFLQRAVEPEYAPPDLHRAAVRSSSADVAIIETKGRDPLEGAPESR